MKESFRIDELARRWDVGERTVRRRIDRGELQSIKIGSRRRIMRDAVERFEKEQSSKKTVT